MKIVKQLAIFLGNQPGALLGVTKDLASREINILALSVSDAVDHAVVRMVVDKPNEALHLLGDAGVLVVDSELLELDLSNKPGALTGLCETLSEIGMNMEYAYGSTGGQTNSGTIYIRVMDPAKVLQALQDKA